MQWLNWSILQSLYIHTNNTRKVKFIGLRHLFFKLRPGGSGYNIFPVAYFVSERSISLNLTSILNLWVYSTTYRSSHRDFKEKRVFHLGNYKNLVTLLSHASSRLIISISIFLCMWKGTDVKNNIGQNSFNQHFGKGKGHSILQCSTGCLPYVINLFKYGNSS